MVYQEKWFRIVEDKRAGIFGQGHRSTFVLLDEKGEGRRLSLLELLDALLGPELAGRQDAYMCIDRATKIFPNGKYEWVGYPSGAVVADPLATDVDAVTLDMLALATLLRLMGQPELAQNYEALAVDLRTDDSAQALTKAREWVRATLQSGPGRVDDQCLYKRDGSVDHYLSDWYDALRDRLGGFANGK